MTQDESEPSIIGFSVTHEAGERVYELTYNCMAPEMAIEPTAISGQGTVSVTDQVLQLPNGDTVPFDEAVFERELDTVRIKRDRSLSGKVVRRFKWKVNGLLERVRQ